MERLKKDLSVFGPSMTFFRDDIEEILAILAASCREVTISDATHTFHSLDELIEKKGQQPTQLSLTGATPHIRLSIKPLEQVHLFATAPFGQDPDPELPFLRIKEYLSNRGGSVGPSTPRPKVQLLWVLGLLPFFALLLPGLIPKPLIHTAALVGAILMIAGIPVSMNDNGFFSRIRLGRRHQATTYWSRNAERLIVGFIGAVLGALASELVHRLVAKAGGPNLLP
jgi:hypothetical protein